MGVFSDIRVLDLSRVLAGPYCGQMLSDFGADVIKIEDIKGDENRNWAPVTDGVGANFVSVNRGKRGLTLNLKSPDGQKILQDLVRKSDVLIDSFLPDVAVRLKVDDASLRAIKPDLIHATISGYGHEGPLASKPGYDLMLQAFSGMMSMTGEPGGGPIRAGASFIDMSTGMLAYAGIASALYGKATGQAPGQHIQVSLLETAIALLGYHVPAYSMAGVEPTRDGSGVWHIVPYQAFETLDGYILAGATNDAAWRRLCDALGAMTLAENPDYATAVKRVEFRVPIIASLTKHFKKQNTEAWMNTLEAAKVACSPLNDMAQTLAHPQIAAMKMMIDVPDRQGGNMQLVGVPINLSKTPAVPGGAPPRLGENTTEILRDELGISNEMIEIYRRHGAI